MAEHVIRLPDIGEGVAEAELVSWLVREGESVKEDQALAEVMTDKATIEIPSPVDGVVTWLGAAAGEKVNVGAPIVRLEVGVSVKSSEPQQAAPQQKSPLAAALPPIKQVTPSALSLAAPALRAKAKELGIDLALVHGTGPGGRIVEADLDAYGQAQSAGVFEDVRIIGLRRRIAERMSIASHVPHITYVEEVDVTALEETRAALNASGHGEKLTPLPFLMCAIARAVAEQPNFNAHYLDNSGVLRRFRAVHIGVATQTEAGLLVPVVRDAQERDLQSNAAEIVRLSQAARDGSAKRDELSGSTITITSLGALGGIVTTPILNHPEVAIIGINKIRVAPQWDGESFQPRKIMNISASFDHRVVDGWDAARFVQKIKTLLEDQRFLKSGFD